MQNDKAPERIWLPGEEKGWDVFLCSGDKEKMFDPIEYIRADLVERWLKQANDKADELQSFVDYQQGVRHEWRGNRNG